MDVVMLAEIEALELARVGTWKDGKVEITPEDLDAAVEAFDAQKQAGETVPWVMDHRAEGPALGVLEKIWTDTKDGVKRLMGRVTAIPESVAEQIKARQILGRSIGFVRGLKLGDRTFRFALDHVSWLGAQRPAVKGMEPIPVPMCDGGDDAVTVRYLAEDSEPPWSEVNPNTLPADQRKKGWYAWTPDDNPSNWRFPYKSKLTGKPHKGGVAAALAALSGARTGKDLTRQYPGVKEKLLAAARSLGMDVKGLGAEATRDAETVTDTQEEGNMSDTKTVPEVATLQEELKTLRETVAAKDEAIRALQRHNHERDIEAMEARLTAAGVPIPALKEAGLTALYGEPGEVVTLSENETKGRLQVLEAVLTQFAKSGVVPMGEKAEAGKPQTDEQAEFLAHAKAVTGNEFADVQAAEKALGYTLADWRE